MTRNTILRIIFLLCLAPTGASAAVYKWVDEQGVTHYSAKAPADKSTKQLKSRSAPSAYGSEQSGGNDLDADMRMQSYQQKREQRKQQQEAEEKMALEKARRCSAAKKRLEMLHRQIRLYKTNDEGEREYMDDSTRESEIDKMQEAVDNNC